MSSLSSHLKEEAHVFQVLDNIRLKNGENPDIKHYTHTAQKHLRLDSADESLAQHQSQSGQDHDGGAHVARSPPACSPAGSA